MSVSRDPSNPCRPLGRRRPRARDRAGLALVLALLAPVAGAAPTAQDGLSLKLDDRMVSDAPQASDGRTQTLVQFGATDLRRRIQLYRDRRLALSERSQEVTKQVQSYEEMIGRLRALNEAQDSTLGVMAQTVPRAPEASAPELAVPASPRPAPAVPLDSNPAPLATLDIAGLSVDRTMLEVFMAALIVVLLVTLALGTRRRGMAAAPALALPEGVPAAALAPHLDDGVPAASPPPAAGGVKRTTASARSSAAPMGPATTVSDRQRPAGETGSSVCEVGEDTDLELDRVLASIHQPDGAQDPADEIGAGSATDVEPGPPVSFETPAAGDWAQARVTRRAVEPDVMKELDTLIAFEHYERAMSILDELLAKDPQNPEYLIRHYHVRTAGGVEAHDGDEELLKLMMDGPLSDTMQRVREIGRSLMPGDPLFDDEGARDAARELLSPPRSEAHTTADDGAATEPGSTRTVMLTLAPKDDARA